MPYQISPGWAHLAKGRGDDSPFLPSRQGRKGLLWGQVGSEEVLDTCHLRPHPEVPWTFSSGGFSVPVGQSASCPQ